MGEHRREQFIVGFALEDKPDITEARRKLERKKADLMVLNPPKALSADANKAIFVTSGSEEILPLMSKRQLAQKILARIHAQMDLKSE
jgi:phosphopantothenoylcysteine decarboxylase/phosphopantothenate--cysteine ligase